MHNFSFFKKTPVKVICSIFLFLVFVGIISFVLYRPFGKIYANSNNYETVVIGASHASCGTVPEIVDEKAETHSCIYASSASRIPDRFEMFLSSSKSKSVKTVVLETSYSILERAPDSYNFDKKILYFPRLSGLASKIDSAGRNFSFWEDQYDPLYAELIFEGLGAWEYILNGTYDDYSNLRGHEVHGNYDQSLDASDAVRLHNSEPWGDGIIAENLSIVKEMARICEEKDIKLIIVTFPITEAALWQYYGWDDYHDTLFDFCSDNHIPYYDMNLLKNRCDYFQDENTFRDWEHLSENGAETMSEMLAEIINAETKGRPSKLEFYDSCEEALKNSSYSKYIK